MLATPTEKVYPVLYSFRRCPFAIRARTAIYFSNIKVEIREISLKNKAKEMLQISKKGTVPVLQTSKVVIDESLDVILWALKISDDKNLLKPFKENQTFVYDFISNYDINFKNNLDRYKYSTRYKRDKSFLGKNSHRTLAEEQLISLNKYLEKRNSLYIYGDSLSILDISIFPLIRQFRIADAEWFDNNQFLKFVVKWLNNLLKSDFFIKVMFKYQVWNKQAEKVYFQS